MNPVTVRCRIGPEVRAVEPAAPAIPASPPPSRIMRQLALAHFIECLVESGTLKDYADAARRLGITRARMTQISNLRWLPGGVQERILSGERVSERELRGRAHGKAKVIIRRTRPMKHAVERERNLTETRRDSEPK